MIYKEDMLQQTHDSECHCSFDCKILKPLHMQFISPILLVQFNWYCELGGDNNEALIWGRDLINLFLPKDVYRRSLFLFLASSPRSRALSSLASSPMFLKRMKRNIKQRLCTG